MSTLKEKFELICGDKIYDSIYSLQCEKIAGDYAIEFAEWCFINDVYKPETFEDDNLFLCGTKKYDDGTDRIYYMYELLKEFKKEKGY